MLVDTSATRTTSSFPKVRDSSHLPMERREIVFLDGNQMILLQVFLGFCPFRAILKGYGDTLCASASIFAVLEPAQGAIFLNGFGVLQFDPVLAKKLTVH